MASLSTPWALFCAKYTTETRQGDLGTDPGTPTPGTGGATGLRGRGRMWWSRTQQEGTGWRLFQEFQLYAPAEMRVREAGKITGEGFRNSQKVDGRVLGRPR